MNKKILIAVFLLFSIPFLLYIGKALLPKEKIVLDQTNKIFVVKGDVRIKKAKADAPWQKMETTTILEKGDIVETAEDSSVDVIIGGNNDKAVRMGQKSYMEFQEINPAYLNLSKGKILVTLKKLEPKSSFVVKTPTAICGAKGTAWLEEVSENRTKVCVFENEVFLHKVDISGRPIRKEYTASEGTERIVLKDKPVGDAQKIGEMDLQDWEYWNKNITFLREGKILVNDFNKKENFNNLGGPFGSWNVFYYDPNQYCRDEFTDQERVGDHGYGLKLAYDVDSPYSAFNGFFTNLMNIDISNCKSLVFFIKGDKKTGFTTKISIELKNRLQIGRTHVDGITDEWKKMVVPLDDFDGITEFKEMKEFVIAFSDIRVDKKEGVLYIDDIYFTKTE